MEATSGMGSLYRHLMSNTSSRNPRRVAESSESSAARYIASYIAGSVRLPPRNIGHTKLNLLVRKVTLCEGWHGLSGIIVALFPP